VVVVVVVVVVAGGTVVVVVVVVVVVGGTVVVVVVEVVGAVPDENDAVNVCGVNLPRYPVADKVCEAVVVITCPVNGALASARNFTPSRKNSTRLKSASLP